MPINELETMSRVRKINEEFPFPSLTRERKARGDKVVGFQCTYIPEELIWASGAIPVRVTGGDAEIKTEDADAYLYTNFCSMVRTCWQLVLEGKWDFLDGYVPSGTCDGCRRLSDVWRFYSEIPMIDFLSVPRKMTERAVQLYLSEITHFKEKLEGFLGTQISEQALWDAIKLYNRTRELLKEMYELRKADQPPIWGSEVVEVLNAGMRIPRDRYNELLEGLLAELKGTNRKVSGQKRLLISGSSLNNPAFLRALESQGGLVVADHLCMGSIYWRSLVDTNSSDPLEAIARRYVGTRVPCARVYPMDTRTEEISSLIREYRVDGVVTRLVRHCVLWMHDEPLIQRDLTEQGIPTLQLDVEYGAGETGQIRTRAQAFLEMLLGVQL